MPKRRKQSSPAAHAASEAAYELAELPEGSEFELYFAKEDKYYRVLVLQHWSEDGAAPWVKCRYVGRAKSKGFWVVGPSPWCAFTQLTQKCTSHALHDDVMRMTGSSSMQLSHALAALPPASEGRRSVAPQPLGHGSPIGRARPSRQPAGRGRLAGGPPTAPSSATTAKPRGGRRWQLIH